MAPYQVYSRNNGDLIAAIHEGTDYWLFHVNDLTRQGEIVTQVTDLNILNERTLSVQDLALTARLRTERANEKINTNQRVHQNFIPFSLNDVVYILEAEYLSAIAEYHGQVVESGTRANTAWEKLSRFIKRQRGDKLIDYKNDEYRYSLADNFVGETAHLRAAHALNDSRPKRTIVYRCTTHPPTNPHFTRFMDSIPTKTPLEDPAPKTNINEELIAPRTIGQAVAAHQKVLKFYLRDTQPARKEQIAAWVAGRFNGAPNERCAGIWIRRTGNNSGHTTDQYLSRDRFQKIFQKMHQAGIRNFIILGDGFPDGEQNEWVLNLQDVRVYDFSRVWEQNSGLPVPTGLQLVPPGQHGGYAEQVAVYTTLYRGYQNPSGNITNINMECIITNKSGGPDLPSLAGVPQIQIAEMANTELMIHHRMGFQSLCSPMWTVLRVPQRVQGQVQTLTQQQQQELQMLITRAGAVHKWHMNELGGNRYTWTK